ncbi:MAG: hypothetical protein V5A30_09090 [Haloarculaceae archaeon]
MTERKLLALALAVFVVMGVVSGGTTVGFLSDSEEVTVQLMPDIPESAGNDTGGDAGNTGLTEAGNTKMTEAGNTDAGTG